MAKLKARKLKAGTAKTTVAFADSLAAEIEDAMEKEWRAVKREPMPSTPDDGEDRKILFAAIAQGLLKYLHDHRNDIATTKYTSGSYSHSHQLNFEWEIKQPEKKNK